MRAALFLKGVFMNLSRQLQDTFSFPPINHFISGFSKFHSKTLSHFLNHVICSSAISDQKPSGSSIDLLYISSYSSMLFIYVFLLNFFEGGNILFSAINTSIASFDINSSSQKY